MTRSRAASGSAATAALCGMQGPMVCARGQEAVIWSEIVCAYRYAVPVSPKALHPLVLLNIPHAHPPVLAPTREILPVRAHRQRPHLVRVSRELSRAPCALSLSLSFALAFVGTGLVECVYLPTGVQVPLDDRALLAGRVEPAGGGIRDGRRHGESVGTFCTY